MSRELHLPSTGRKSVLFVALWALLMALPGLCRAQTTITVNSLLYPRDSGKCTLHDALLIAEGGSETPGDSCTTSGSGSPYTINFIVTGTITIDGPIRLSGTNLTIAGPTTAPGIAINSAADFSSIMTIGSNATILLDDLTIAKASSLGGAISNGGQLTVLNCTFEHNIATGSKFLGGGQGGAIENTGGGTLTVLNSTFYDNHAKGEIGENGEGGAIFGSATIVNSTFYDNGALRGGAIFSVGRMNVVNSTFYDDKAGVVGGAIFNGGGTAIVKNTILVGSTDSSGINNCAGTSAGADPITDGGYNVSDDTSCGFSQNFIMVGSADDVLDTEAGLTDNGGPTETIAEVPESPSIDAIPVAACTYPADVLPNPCSTAGSIPNQLTCDQRGEPRPDPGASPAGCDVGAFQLQDTTITFAAFHVAATIHLPDNFHIAGSFQLGGTSSGINPVTEPVTVTLGPGTLTIPAGSFTKFLGTFLFRGTVGGVKVQAYIVPSFRNSYLFEIQGDGLTLTGVSNPVTVGLQIGNDAGTASINAVIHSSKG